MRVWIDVHMEVWVGRHMIRRWGVLHCSITVTAVWMCIARPSAQHASPAHPSEAPLAHVPPAGSRLERPHVRRDPRRRRWSPARPCGTVRHLPLSSRMTYIGVSCRDVRMD